jgi:dihydroxyacid dehydratase/phosphogluconate dehydratase
VPHDQFDGRPVIGICNTFSELTPCNSHFRTLAEQVKIGVYEADRCSTASGAASNWAPVPVSGA